MSGRTELKDILSPSAALLLPGGQAILTGIATGTIGGSLARVLQLGEPVPVAILSGSVGFGAGLLYGLSWWRSRVSAILGELSPGAMTVYPVESSGSSLQLSIDWDEGRAGLFDDLNITDDQFIKWCCGVGSGMSLGENHWTGSVNPFSKGQYHKFIDRMDKRHGMVRRASKATNATYILTSKGRAVVNEVLRRYGDNSPILQSYNPGA